jgi:diguanylate cyclase (GGDEF)-like protein
MTMVRSVITSVLVFVAFCTVFGIWLLVRPNDNNAVLTFFLVGVVLVGIDLVRQLHAAHQSRAQYDRRVDDAERAADLNRKLQRAQQELTEANAGLEVANERLTSLAGLDPVTMLPGQEHMDRIIDAEIERSRRSKRPFALLFLDLDHFKELNERHGHEAGDEALREFAGLLGTTVRRIDTIGRWNSEEFVVLLPDADSPAAVQAGERVRSVVAEHVYRVGGEGVYLTCSVGIAAYPVDGQDRVSLISMADHAMYVAKKLGRNQVRSTSDPMVSATDAAGSADGAPRRTAWTVVAMSEAVEHLVDEEHRGSPYTHALTVLSVKIARTMGLSDDEAHKVGIAAQLQNVGNVAIPDAIMQKKSSLTDEERAIVQRHAAVGADIVAGVPALSELAPIIRAHHEWWNGGGYPGGLREEEIPLGARILAVVDVYKALTSDRPHRPGRNPRVAFDELRFRSGTQFDPQVVEALQRALSPNPAISERLLVEEYRRAYHEKQKNLAQAAGPGRNYLGE